jgi:hypothetical protein
MTTLSDLAHFCISQLDVTSDGAVFRGDFTHLRGVRKGRSWLYAGVAESLIGDLADLDTATGVGTFVAPFWKSTNSVQAGSAVPWIDGYWQAYQIAMIIADESDWQRTRFVPRAGQFYVLGGVRGCGVVGQPLPQGAVPTHIDPAGWDHEHCEIWGEKIGVHGDAFGYVDSQNHWLCEACFVTYAARRDLAFVIESA